MIDNIWIILASTLFFGFSAGMLTFALVSAGKNEDQLRESM